MPKKCWHDVRRATACAPSSLGQYHFLLNGMPTAQCPDITPPVAWTHPAKLFVASASSDCPLAAVEVQAAHLTMSDGLASGIQKMVPSMCISSQQPTSSHSAARRGQEGAA
jgi:hypothetical protein